MAADSAEAARVLEQCERDLDLAIERLVNLRLDPEDDDAGASGGAASPEIIINNAAAAAAAAKAHRSAASPAAPSGGIRNRGEWVERLMVEMASAGDVGDARARAGRFLGEFLAAERDGALRQNGVLKKAVLVQYHRHKEGEAGNAELRRQLAGCQERVRSLETDNYALAMYLRRAQPQGGAIAGSFHPEVF
ncbi:unnamed protein product [Urochloa decumbens]|uniref:Uncharacterized protein n=1 Tax=Urochloa decumbens TaxID=240449 RepID=A0ABC8YYV6_9POAL